MAGGGSFGRLPKDWKSSAKVLTNALKPSNGLVAFDWTPESSRILQFWTSEEAQCVLERIQTMASRLLLRSPSDWRFYTSYSIVNLVVYLCAKFGALNPRINEIRSGENRSHPPPRERTPRFFVLPILWLSDLVVMFPKASGTIMDKNLHSSSHLCASQHRDMLQPQTQTSDGKFH